jgi:ElaB/YqjD/DUF883 family membrane-anchored ribosome-binding protein
MNQAMTTNAHHGNRTHELRKHARVVRKDLRELGHLSRRAAKNAASTYYRSGKAKFQQLGETVSDYVQENPIKSVLIATATGALFGAIWSRRR